MTTPLLPSDDVIKKILANINMNEKSLEEGVTILREWLKKQPHLPKSADDVMLKSFIIGCKSVERAKVKLDAYYTIRVKYASPFFENRDPFTLSRCKGQKMMILPGWTPDGCKVILFQLPPKESLGDFLPADSFRMVLMYYEMIIRRHYMNSGVYVISDMSNMSIELTLKSSLTLSSQFSKIYQEGYPIRLRGFIGFNAPPIAEGFFNTFMKAFFSQKLKERIILHADDQTCLEKYFPLHMLPSDYGGNNPSSSQLSDEDQKRLENMKDWLLKEGSEIPIEDFRPKVDNDEMKGTFRKLDVE